MNKIVLFDIDYTIFDPVLFRNKSFKAIAQHIHYPDQKKFLQIAEDIYQTSKKEIPHFDPQAYIPKLAQAIKIDLNSKILNTIIMQERILEESLYHETIEVFEILGKQKRILLGIFSRGNIPVQRAKINLLTRFLHKEHIHIFDFDKIQAVKELLKRYKKNEKIFIIDDYQDVLREAKKLNKDIVTIWIKRPELEGKRKIFPNFIPDSIISNLKEALPFLIS